MNYEWEAEAKRLLDDMQNGWDMLPDHLQVVGVAFENTDTGEGALVEAHSGPAFKHAVTEADVRKDVLGDAESQYQRTYDDVFGGKGASVQ